MFLKEQRKLSTSVKGRKSLAVDLYRVLKIGERLHRVKQKNKV